MILRKALRLEQAETINKSPELDDDSFHAARWVIFLVSTHFFASLQPAMAYFALCYTCLGQPTWLLTIHIFQTLFLIG